MAPVTSAEAKWRTLIENAPDFIMTIDGDGRLLFVNRLQPGLKMEDVLRSTIYDYTPAVRRPKLEKIVKRVFTSLEPAQFEIEGPGPFGLTAWYACRIGPVGVEKNKAREAMIIATDITEHKKAQDELRLFESLSASIGEARDLNSAFKALLRTVCDTTGWVLGQAFTPDAEKNCLVCSPAWYSAVEGMEKFRKDSLQQRFTPGRGLPGRCWADRKAAWISNVALDSNFPRAKTAIEVGIRAAYAIPVLAEQEVIAVIEFFVLEEREEDTHLMNLVTAVASQLGSLMRRKRAESARGEYERRFRDILENVHLATVCLDTEGRMTFCNDFLLALSGWTLDEVLGRNWFDVFMPDASFRSSFLESLRHGDIPRQAKGEITTRYGDKRLIAWNNLLLHDGEGRVIGTASLGEDITAKKRDDEEADNESQRFVGIYRSAKDAISYATPEGVLLDINGAFERLSGYSKDELCRLKKYQELTPPSYHAFEERLVQQVFQTGEAAEYEKELIRNDGKRVPVWVTAFRVQDHNGRNVAIAAMLRDLSEKKKYEEDLQKSEERYRALAESLPQSGEFTSLTPKELQVCDMIKRGYSSKDISSRLHISLLTVETHRNHIRRKIGLSRKKINLTYYLQTI